MLITKYTNSMFLSFIFAAFLIFPLEVMGQPSSCNKDIGYNSSLIVNKGIIKLRRVEGKALVIFPEQYESSIVKMCLGLFTAKEHKLVSVTQTSSDGGSFDFGKIPSGEYHLVTLGAPTSNLCDLIVPIKVIDYPQGGILKRNRLYLHMRFIKAQKLSYASTKMQKNKIKTLTTFSK